MSDRPEGPFYTPWDDPERAHEETPAPTSHTGAAGRVESVVLGTGRLVDKAQSRFAPVAFGYAVFKKYADDEGSRLAALLAYYTFLSIFPLAIGGVAVLSMVLSSRPQTVQELVDEVVPENYQADVLSAYNALPDSGVALTVALVGLLLAGTGGAFALYAAVNQIFSVPYRHRFGFGPRYARVLAVLMLTGVGVFIFAAVSVFVGSWTGEPNLQRLIGFVTAVVMAFAVLYLSPKLLIRRPLGPSELLLGACIGAVSIATILTAAGWITGRLIANSSAVYGALATVVAFISVLFLGSNLVVFSYEVSVVRAWRLWPRGVDINLLFPADERAYALLTIMDERMPSQRNGTMFDAEGHDDPRRPDPLELRTWPTGVPKTPYA